MSKLNDLHDLIANVDDVRTQKYPNIPKDLVEEIIQAEYEQLDSRPEGMRRVSEIISRYLVDNGTNR